MCEEWMPFIKFKLHPNFFHQLPKHPAYKYELINGQAWLTPRPKFYHARLNFRDYSLPDELQNSEEMDLKPAANEDLPKLVDLFAGAFHRLQPFGSLTVKQLEEAATACLERTAEGGDGPFIPEASFIAHDKKDGTPVGAALITLLPDGDPLAFNSYHWKEPPQVKKFSPKEGRAHLTWIFVHWLHTAQGLGTSLLNQSISALKELGFKELYSTFLLGNESSMLWHWRNGFELLSFPGSVRRIRASFDREIIKKSRK